MLEYGRRGGGGDVRRGVVAATDFELFSISLHFPHFENIVCIRAGKHRLANNTFFFKKSLSEAKIPQKDNSTIQGTRLRVLDKAGNAKDLEIYVILQ